MRPDKNLFFLPRFVTTGSALILSLAVSATALRAQDDWEWEADEGYHQEEWYDPSDWFNGDDRVDYEYDWSTYDDYDSNYYDWGYYYPYYDPYYDYGYYDGYDYDYDYDGVAEDWDSNSEFDDWSWQAEDETWARTDEGAQSGDRDSRDRSRQQGQRNRGDDRSRDMQGRRNQGRSGQDRKQQDRSHQGRDMSSVRGTLESYRTVQLKGQKDRHTVVKIELEDGSKRLVNLGPKVDLEQLDLDAGKQVEIHGRKGHIDGQSVLMATRVRSSGETTRVRSAGNRPNSGRDDSDNRSSGNRAGDLGGTRPGSSAKVRGELDSWKKMTLGNGDRREHLFVRLRTDEGREAIVNFGPNTELRELDFSRGDRVSIRGSKRRVNGRDVIFARDVSLESDPVNLDWRPQRNPRDRQSDQRDRQSGQNDWR